MDITVMKERRANEVEYYKAYDVKRVNGKVVQKYVCYPGKSPNSTNKIEAKVLLQDVERLIKKNISQEAINSILKKMGIEYDVWLLQRLS